MWCEFSEFLEVCPCRDSSVGESQSGRSWWSYRTAPSYTPGSGTEWSQSNGFFDVETQVRLLLLTHLGIDLVLLLFLLHGIVNTADNFCHHLVIQVPGNTLEWSIIEAKPVRPGRLTSKILFLSCWMCSGRSSSLLMICSISIPDNEMTDQWLV